MEISDFQYLPIDLYRIDLEGQVSMYQQPYRVGMFDYLNAINVIATANSSNYTLSIPLLQLEPTPNISTAFNDTSFTKQQIYFSITNGLRSLRTYTEKVTDYQEVITLNFLKVIIFTIYLLKTHVYGIMLFYYINEQKSVKCSKISII